MKRQKRKKAVCNTEPSAWEDQVILIWFCLRRFPGVQLTPIHYHGGAPLLTDLLGGHVPMGFLSTALVTQQIKDGTLRAVGVTGNKRIPEFPELPSIAETVPGYESVSWFGLFAPESTPPEIVQKINSTFSGFSQMLISRRSFSFSYSINVRPGTAKEFSDYVSADLQSGVR